MHQQAAAQGISLLERVQKVTRGSLDMAKVAMELERLRHTLPRELDDGGGKRESPADAIVYIEEAHKIVQAANEAKSLTEEDFLEYGKIPTAPVEAEATPT